MIPMPGYHSGNWSGGDWFAMGSMMLLFWAAVIAVVVWAVRSVRNERQHPERESNNTPSPQDILAERFARGEIEEDEFARRYELLHNTSSSGTKPRSTP
jgi:putative membrane protein